MTGAQVGQEVWVEPVTLLGVAQGLGGLSAYQDRTSNCSCVHKFAHIHAPTHSAATSLPFLLVSLWVGNGFIFWACKKKKWGESSHTHFTLKVHRRERGMERWEKPPRAQAVGRVLWWLLVFSTVRCTCPQQPQSRGSGAPRYLPPPSVFKRLWFGQLFKCKKRFQRKVLVVGPQPEGPGGLFI